MDDKTLRQILGALAGAITGAQAGRDGLMNKAGATFAGGTGGIFAADIINALQDLANGRSGQSPSADLLTEMQAFIRGYCLGKASLPSLLEGISGETLDSIVKERLGLSSDVQERLIQEKWPAIEKIYRQKAYEYLKDLQSQMVSLGIPQDILDLDLDRDLAIWTAGMRQHYKS